MSLQKSKKNDLPVLPVLVCLYLILLAFHGYIYGQNDLVEMLPYAKYLNDPSLYPNDFYISYISREIPNERYLFSLFLSWTGTAMPYVSGILHLLFSILLMAGLYRIASFFINTQTGILLFLILLFLPFYQFNLGGNNLYYNMFVPSLVAKAIGVWGLVYFLDNKNFPAFALIALSAFLHPVAGAQLFLLCSGVLMLGKLFNKIPNTWKNILPPIAGFLLTAGLWTAFLKLNFDKGNISNQLLFEITEFRFPHHYLPSYYSKKGWLILLPIIAFGGYFFLKKNFKLFGFFVLAIIGLVFFTIGVEVVKSPSIFSSQWFKTTIWLKAFSLIALVSWTEAKFRIFESVWLKNVTKVGILALTLIALLGMANPFSIFENKPYDFAFRTMQSEAIDIAKRAKDLTPKNALFILPTWNTTFKYFSERSSFVDYKTMVHRKDGMQDWYQRIKEVYKVDINDRIAESDHIEKANAQFEQLNESDLQELKTKYGVTHIQTSKSHELRFLRIAEVGNLVIYEIQ